MEPHKIGMIGGGSWATALVKVLNQNGHVVKWWMRDAALVKSFLEQGHNARYLSSVLFQKEQIQPTTHLSTVVSESDILFLAVPSAHVQEVLSGSPAWKNKIVVSAVKGMIPGENLLIAEFLTKYCGVSPQLVVNISGPSHAEEVAMEKLTYLTLAGLDAANASLIAGLLQCGFIRCHTSDDVYGTEYAAVLKNIYAITAGIFNGMGYGDNFHAVLVSNCIEEMERFLRVVHPITRDIKDSPYLGDLLVTAYSQFSRNRMLGTMLGKGYSVRNALLEMNMVAEGYYASLCIHSVNKTAKVAMPVAGATYRVLHEGKDVRSEMEKVVESIH